MQVIEPGITNQKEIRRQPHRIYMARLVIFNMLIESVVLGLFAYAGTIPVCIAVLFLIVSVGISIFIYAFFKLGLNLRFADKNMLIPQLLINGVIQVGFLLLAPKLTILFLMVLVILAGYAVIEFNPRQYTIGWLIYGVVSAVTLWCLDDRFSYPGTSGIEVALVWLFFFLTLRSLTLASASFSRLREKLTEKNRQLEISLRQIEELASKDYLTGVFNRRHFMSMLDTEMQRSERSGRPFCLVMLDLDLFKNINDHHGHPVGDEVLKVVCRIARGVLRGVDGIGRLGGEEFAVLLPETPLEAGFTTMERVRTAVRVYDWNTIAQGLAVSFSAGIACHIPDDTVQTMSKRADDALYRAKNGGRDRVIIAKPELAGHVTGAGR